MPKVTVLPHPEYSPKGLCFEAQTGETVCDALRAHGAEVDHACGKVGACTTCHVVVRTGFDALNSANDSEEDMLDRAWGLDPQSRLACQAVIGNGDVVIDIPRYSINHAKENP